MSDDLLPAFAARLRATPGEVTVHVTGAVVTPGEVTVHVTGAVVTPGS